MAGEVNSALRNAEKQTNKPRRKSPEERKKKHEKFNNNSNQIIPHPSTEASLAGHGNSVARRGFIRRGRKRQRRKPVDSPAAIARLRQYLRRMERGLVEMVHGIAAGRPSGQWPGLRCQRRSIRPCVLSGSQSPRHRRARI